MIRYGGTQLRDTHAPRIKLPDTLEIILVYHLKKIIYSFWFLCHQKVTVLTLLLWNIKLHFHPLLPFFFVETRGLQINGHYSWQVDLSCPLWQLWKKVDSSSLVHQQYSTNLRDQIEAIIKLPQLFNLQYSGYKNKERDFFIQQKLRQNAFFTKMLSNL